ncbi:hypothetical protein BASA61_007777 [Batrachochytrium salamandrivorans]|nr:hypothetical protein BASA62_001797 [Batrachochytrium salamandrivorans]KAH6584015.1 hypothetical protein BASA61_007777 [Batrachochytrium salamandrivorans]KAH9269890.1 hypothetical protein BASA83_008045 [Batrachochytrium salamandrivorans]
MAATTPTFFGLICSGQIESAHFPEFDNLYCKFSFLQGPDWSILSGLEEGISQFAKGRQASTATEFQSPIKPCIWNFPIDITFKSTNPYGWPQLLVTVYGLDSFGRDVIRGYGAVSLPTTTGQHTVYVPMFVPIATSPFNQFYSWIQGRPPEFLDPKFAGKGKGRKVTRVRSQGTAKVQLHILTKDLESLGYTVGRAG